jgi:RimJ/RimL family protein N-acetyltransferase
MRKRCRIRKATSDEDFAAIRMMDRRLFPQDDPPEVPGDSLWWVAVCQRYRVIVAYGGLRPCKAAENRGVAFLIRAGTDPKYRGQGLQTRLIRARIVAARRMGLKHLVTYTVPWNPASGNALIRKGFKLYSPATRWGGAGAAYWSRKA